jgi:DnaJ domain
MSDPGIEKDYYSILGACETATQDEIERLYKRLAFRHHPDRGGDAEEMKLINEAYWVLGNAATRRTYDSRRWQGKDALSAAVTSFSPASAPLRNEIPERLTRAMLFLLGGLIFLFLVRVYYIRFMWPILVAAVVIVIFGVWKIHGVMVFARTRIAQTDRSGRYVWVQELAFWSIVCAGAYGIYLVMNAI